MPEQGGQLEWAKVNAGIKVFGDISPDKLNKVDALRLLHQFVLHTPLKPVGEEKMRDYWDIIKASHRKKKLLQLLLSIMLRRTTSRYYFDILGT